MPRAPLFLADLVFARPELARERSQHEEGELGGSFGENVSSIGERNLVAVGICAVNVVEADGDLGDDFQVPLPRFKDFAIDLVAKSCDQAVNAGADFFNNQFSGWS